MLLKKSGEPLLHRTIVIVKPAVLGQNKITYRREPEVFEDGHLGRGGIDLRILSIPICLKVLRALVGEPGQLGYSKDSAKTML